MRAVANASVDGDEADAGSGHPTRWRVSLSGGGETYQEVVLSKVATLRAARAT